MSGLTHLSLFTGIGGLDLAAEWAGFETVGQCEYADYPTRVLEKHWPAVPRWKDIRTLTKESFIERTGLRTVDVISGGFPCQPFSVAGKRGGTGDDRYLWPEMLRIIRDLRPTWVVGENVPGIIDLALDQVLADLESEGYEVQTLLIPACGVNAWHKRERVCIVAYTNHGGSDVCGIQKFQASQANAGEGPDHGRGTEKLISGERRQGKPGMVGMVSGVQQSLDWPDSDTYSIAVQGRCSSEICGGGYDTEVN